MFFSDGSSEAHPFHDGNTIRRIEQPENGVQHLHSLHSSMISSRGFGKKIWSKLNFDIFQRRLLKVSFFHISSLKGNENNIHYGIYILSIKI